MLLSVSLHSSDYLIVNHLLLLIFLFAIRGRKWKALNSQLYLLKDKSRLQRWCFQTSLIPLLNMMQIFWTIVVVSSFLTLLAAAIVGVLTPSSCSLCILCRGLDLLGMGRRHKKRRCIRESCSLSSHSYQIASRYSSKYKVVLANVAAAGWSFIHLPYSAAWHWLISNILYTNLDKRGFLLK